MAMGFRAWMEGNDIEIVPFKVLFQYGMSGAGVEERKQVVQLEQKVHRMDPGELGLLLDEGKDWMIVAIPGGFGFQAYKTPSNIWTKTGRWFAGTLEEFRELNKKEAGFLNLEDLRPLVEEAQRRNPKIITGVFWKERQVVIIFFHKPKGNPMAYFNPFQIVIQANRPQLYGITVYAKIPPDPHVNTRTLYSSREEVASALVAAIDFLKMVRKKK